MNDAERLLATLNFEHPKEGAVVETFFPWDEAVDRWVNEGLPEKFNSKHLYPETKTYGERYCATGMSNPVYDFEQHLGYDGVKRMGFNIPFSCFDEKIIEQTDEYTIKRGKDGWVRKYVKGSAMVVPIKPIVTGWDDWKILKEKTQEHLDKYVTAEQIQKSYGQFVEDHNAGKFSIRFRADGFFWIPRELFGDEEEFYAFFDMPDLIKDINQFIVDTYLKYYSIIFPMLKPEIVLFSEDISGKNGPMISPDLFNEFVSPYYKQLFPKIKEMGVKNVFVDTDGDFNLLIPHFMDAGVDGFIPMDVNAGMDVVKVRELYPTLKIIGAFNKLEIEKGPEAIDREFERIKPVIKQGGYLPGSDHQVPPSASFENYKYYIKKLREVMNNN